MPQKRMAARGPSPRVSKSPLSSRKDLNSKPKKPLAPKNAEAVSSGLKKKKPTASAAQAKVKALIDTVKETVKDTVKSPVAKASNKAISKAISKGKEALKKEKASSQDKTETTEVGAKPAKSRGRRISIDINPNEAASALSVKWMTLYRKSEQIEAKPYNMRAVFEEKTAIVHKVLGWGYILANRNDRLEVLFKDGIKYLISNYKP